MIGPRQTSSFEKHCLKQRNLGYREPSEAYHAVKRGAIVFQSGLCDRVYTRDTSLPYNVIIIERTPARALLEILSIPINYNLRRFIPSLSRASVTSARKLCLGNRSFRQRLWMKRTKRHKIQWLSLIQERLNVSTVCNFVKNKSQNSNKLDFYKITDNLILCKIKFPSETLKWKK